MPKERNKDRRDHLWIFIALTFAWTWIAGFTPLLLEVTDSLFAIGVGEIATNDALFKFLAGPAPSLVAVAIVLITYTKAQKKDYFRRAFSVRQMGIKWPLLTMAFYTVVLGAIVLVSTSFMGGSMPGFEGIRTLLRQPYMIFLYLFFAVISGPLNEEFGWRGFALDRLFVRYNFWKGSVILGFIWGIWHLPWFFYPGNGQYIFWQASPIHAVMYIVSTITLACFVSVVYIKTNRSIMAGAFVHMISNFFNSSPLIFPFDDTYMIALIYVRIVFEGIVILYFARNQKFRSEVKSVISSLKCSVSTG